MITPLLNKLKFPVYAISKNDGIWEHLNIYYIKVNTETLILDNKNLNGDTLGKRRLALKDKTKLYKFSKTINTVIDLIKCKHYPKFIDSNGTVFNYKKSKYVPLIYRKILSSEAVEGLGVTIGVKDIPVKFLTSGFTETALLKAWAGILLIDDGYLLYEISNELKNDTRRLI